VALITTRLRSAPGYPAMAARCALLAPGRRAPPARRALVPNGHPCCPPPHQRPTTASPTRAARAIRIARTSPSHLVLAGRDAPAPMARSKQHTRIHNAHTPLIVKLSSNNHPLSLTWRHLRLHGFTGSSPTSACSVVSCTACTTIAAVFRITAVRHDPHSAATTSTRRPRVPGPAPYAL
jgi:hypothetical protein